MKYEKFKENYKSWHPLADENEIKEGWEELKNDPDLNSLFEDKEELCSCGSGAPEGACGGMMCNPEANR